MKKNLYILCLLMLPLLVVAQEDRIYKSLDEVTHPDDVYYLKLNYKRMRHIPTEVFTFRNLRVLDLGKNFIDSLPPAIGQLSHLEVLDLSRNYLRNIPPELGNLRNLKELNLSRNPLLELPDELGRLDSLQILTLWSTGIIYFPPTFVALDSHLKVIDLRVCPLSYDNQQDIEALLPTPRKRWDHACNCK